MRENNVASCTRVNVLLLFSLPTEILVRVLTQKKLQNKHLPRTTQTWSTHGKVEHTSV